MVWETSSASSFPWGDVTIFEAESDVREEVTKLLDNRGHTVFVRKRLDPPRRCACMDKGQYEEPSISCDKCDGYGWVYRDYRYKTRRRPAFGTYGFAPKISAPIGTVVQGDSIFYFKYDEPISEAYRILEVAIDEYGDPQKAYKIERVHDIKFAHAYRDQQGRIEYWAALTREFNMGKT